MIRHIVEPISYGSKEAQSRVKIDKLLEEAGWCFEPNEKGIAPAEITLLHLKRI